MKRDPRSVTTWDFATGWGLDPKEFWGSGTDFVRAPGFCSTLLPMQSATVLGAAFRAMHELGEVLIVTSAMPNAPTWHNERLRWLAQYLNIPAKEVIFTERKDLVRGDVLIDDGPHNLAAAHPHMLTICINAPYNQDAVCDHRVANIYEAAMLLRDMWNAPAR